MAWRSRDAGRQSAGRWTHRDWDNWRRSQDWSPSQPQQRGDRRARRDAAYKEELDQELEQVKEIIQPAQNVPEPDEDVNRHTSAVVAEKRRNASRLQAAIKLRSSLGEDQSALALALDEDISRLRHAARSLMPPAKAVEEATVSLAESRVRLARATRHLQSAVESRESAELEVQRRTEELQEALRIATAPNHSAPAPVAAQTMANLFSEMHKRAVFSSSGETCTVDSQFLEQISQVLASTQREAHCGMSSFSQDVGNAETDPYGMETDLPSGQSTPRIPNLAPPVSRATFNTITANRALSHCTPSGIPRFVKKKVGNQYTKQGVTTIPGVRLGCKSTPAVPVKKQSKPFQTPLPRQPSSSQVSDLADTQDHRTQAQRQPSDSEF